MYKSEKSWSKIIKAYEQSSLKKAEFCKKQYISANQFYYWCTKLRPDLNTESSNFLPIKTTKDQNSISITLSSGMNISFDSVPDPAWFAKLITSMSAAHDKH